MNLVTVHGVGKNTIGFSEKMALYLNANDWCEATWDSVFVTDQAKLTDHITKTYPAGPWNTLRHYAVNYVGDALGYIDSGSLAYTEVNDCLLRCIIETALKGPTIIVGHSLGTLVTSNVLWDYHSQNREWHRQVRHSRWLTHSIGMEDVKKAFDNIHGVVTMGSPLAQTSLSRHSDGGSCVHQALNKDRYVPWINIWSRFDQISAPLSQLNDSHSLIQDHEVRIGGILSRTPFCHTKYWESNKVFEIVKSIL